MNIQDLFMYPVKSCKGHRVEFMDLKEHGPFGDRIFVVTDTEGKFMSQRTHPKMCLIDAYADGVELHLTASGFRSVDIAYVYDEFVADKKYIRSLVIHKDQCEGYHLNGRADTWFSEFLGTQCVLLQFMPRTHPRMHESSSLGKRFKVSFADAFPLLVTTQESLDDLNRRLGERGHEPVGMERFRPNIVISGAQPYEEDTWNSLHIHAGGIRLEAGTKCTRCIVTATKQESGEREEEPFKLLKEYRPTERGPAFGRNFLITNMGTMRSGSDVHAT